MSLCRNIAFATLVTLGTLGLLLYPFPPPISGQLIDGVDKVAHLMLFGAMAWSWRRVLGESHRRRLLLGASLSGLALVVELIQPLTGRSCDALDWVAGTLGVIVGVTFPVESRGQLVGMGIVLGLCGGVFLVPPFLAVRAERAAWPQLVDDTGWWAAERWLENGMEVDLVEGEGIRLTSTEDDVPWRGVFRHPACADWSKAGDLEVRWFWGGDKPGIVGIRIDPEIHEHREPTYAERFQLEVQTTPGENWVGVPAAAWRLRGDGTGWETSEVRQWGFFLVDAPDFEYVLLHKVRFLNMENIAP